MATSETERIGMVGLGYVGFSLVSAFAESGYSVVGYDLDQRKIATGDEWPIHRLTAHVVDVLENEAKRSVPDGIRKGVLSIAPTPVATSERA